SEEAPDSALAKQLHLDEGARVIRLERLRLEHDDPIMYCVDYVPRSILTARLYDIDWSGSLLALLDQYKQRPRMSAASVSAVMLPQDVVDRNDLRNFGPALLITETCFNA
uniref:UTRA domain-containing protein n=1 Tax=Klebsiella pneumoniae TaxID=573 RepID=UPI0013D0700D